MEDSQSTEGLNVRIGEANTRIYPKAKTAETRKRTFDRKLADGIGEYYERS
jgi:hypothetical protein